MLTTQTTYSTGSGSGPSAVTAADVNGDNKLDIIVANYGTGNVGVLLNTGNGTFTGQTTYSTGSTSYSVAVVDVNGDNKVDIIVANLALDNVGVLLNRGNGTFTAQTTYSTGSNSNPFCVATADVNGDNKPDIIVANNSTNNVGVLLNRGHGTFTAQTMYSTGSGSNPSFVAAADINGDDKFDIIVASYNTNNVGVLLNTGNGTFVAPTTYATDVNSTPHSAAAVDVNRDNKTDVIVPNYGTDNTGVLLANC